ncbi:MAG: TMEM14 family protein [Verrucomicrobia bacterium]|nr:TMEM14 family protein [Verrucomicrobiota bacterium]
MKKSTFCSLAVALFGLACVVGGAIGYLKANSLPSLLVGCGGGFVLLFCARKIKHGSRYAALIALFLTTAIGLRFLVSFIETHKLVPHLPMMGLALLAFFGAVQAAKLRKKARA